MPASEKTPILRPLSKGSVQDGGQGTQATPSLLSLHAKLQVLGGVVFLCLCAGITYGFNALKTVYIKEGVYAHTCPPGTKQFPCTTQLLKLNSIFEIAAAVVNFGGLPLGLMLDRIGRHRMLIIWSIVWSLSTMLMGFASPTFDVYVLGYSLMSLSGGAMMMSFVSLGGDHPHLQGLIVALMTSMWDVSSIIFVGFHEMYSAFGIATSMQFLVYGAVVGLAVTLFSVFIMRPEDPRPVVMPDDYEPVADDDDSSEGENAPINPPVAHGGALTFDWSILREPDMLACFATTCCMFVHMYFFLGTVFDMSLWATGQDIDATRTQTRVFSILLPVLGLATSYPLGKLLDWLPQPAWFLCLGLSGLLWGGLSALRLHDVAYAVYVVYIVWRILVYDVISVFILENHPEAFGRLQGLTVSIGGIASFLVLPVDSFVAINMRGDFTLVNIILTAFSAVSALLCAWIVHRQVRRRASGLDSMKQLGV